MSDCISRARKDRNERGIAHKRAAPKVALLALLLPACFGLVACGSSTSAQNAPTEREAAEQASAQRAALFQQERQGVVELVACARRHGIYLPEPDAHNNVNTRGAHVRAPHNKAILNACARQATRKLQGESRALEREQTGGPRRLGEEPAG